MIWGYNYFWKHPYSSFFHSWPEMIPKLEVTFSALKRSLMGSNEVTFKNLVWATFHETGWLVGDGCLLTFSLCLLFFLMRIWVIDRDPWNCFSYNPKKLFCSANLQISHLHLEVFKAGKVILFASLRRWENSKLENPEMIWRATHPKINMEDYYPLGMETFQGLCFRRQGTNDYEKEMNVEGIKGNSWMPKCSDRFTATWHSSEIIFLIWPQKFIKVL